MVNRSGFSLVELLLAISFFGIVSAAIFGLTMASSSMRRDSIKAARAQTYANGMLELYKDAWSEPDSYNAGARPTNALLKYLDPANNIDNSEFYATFAPPELSDDQCYVAGAVGSCATSSALRYVSVTIKDKQGDAITTASSIIGRPVQ